MSLPIEWPELPNRLYTLAEMQAAMNEAYAEGRADDREEIAKLCDEESAEMRKQGEGCKDGRYDWMADGIDALADALRGIDSATGHPADMAAVRARAEPAASDLPVGRMVARGGCTETKWNDRRNSLMDGEYLLYVARVTR